VRRYGRAVSDLPYWVAFSLWRSACIGVGMRARARRRMRPVLDARPDLARAAGKYAARRSAAARMGIAVLCWADA
jgi:hypothetical protein